MSSGVNDVEEHKLYENNLPKVIRDFVLERDNNSCRSCNSNYMIGVHHIMFKSEKRYHHHTNLITLCGECHRRLHDGHLKLVVIDGNYFFGGSHRWKR